MNDPDSPEEKPGPVGGAARPRYNRTWRWLVPLSALAVVGALAAAGPRASAGGTVRSHVGPWDVDDIPPLPADLEPKLIPDPDKAVRVSGYRAELPGLTIELHGISRTVTGPSNSQISVNSRSWTPDGGLYDGPELGYAQPLFRSTREGAGARYLDFGVTSTVSEPILLYGYVPQSAHLGSDPPEDRGLTVPANCDFTGMSLASRPKGFTQKYRPAVVVENNRTDRFLLGVAQGPWMRLAGYTDVPPDLGSGAGLSGHWGTVKFKIVKPSLKSWDDLGAIDSHRPPAPPTVRIVVSPTKEPRAYAYRVRLYDKKGASVPLSYPPDKDNSSTFDEAICRLSDWKNVTRMDIDGRRLVYLEFANVHYYPDARLWPEMRWGSEGFGDARKVEGVGELEGIVAPKPGAAPDRPANLFTPAGIRWAEYPDQRNLVGYGFETPEGGRSLTALFRLDAGLSGNHAPEIVAFSSDSARPGEGLINRIGTFSPPPAALGQDGQDRVCPLRFAQPPTSPYVQFRVRLPDPKWRSIGSVKTPAGPFVGRSGAELARSRDGSPLVTALSVNWNLAGELSFTVTRPDLKVEDQPRLLSWDPESKQIRLILRLRSGRRIVLYTENAEKVGATPGSGNVTTTCSVCHEFHLDDSGEALLVLPWSAELTTGGRPSEKSIRLRDVDGFEIETRALSSPVYVVAKLPPPDSKDASRNGGAADPDRRRP